MSYQDLTQALGQASAGARTRVLRPVVKGRQHEMLRRLGLVGFRLLPLVVLLNICLALVIDRVEVSIQHQEYLISRENAELKRLKAEHAAVYDPENIRALAASRLNMEAVEKGHYGKYNSKAKKFIFN